MARTRRSPQSARSNASNSRPDPESDGPVLQALNRAGAAARIALRGVRLVSRLERELSA